MSKKTFTLVIIIVLAAIGGVYYWFFVRTMSSNLNTNAGGSGGSSAIFGNTGNGGTSNGNKSSGAGSSGAGGANTSSVPLPVLRELSTTPVGGMDASTTASSTIVRWVDRGVGRVYQANSNNLATEELSNTTIPQIYATYWNAAATSFILQSLTDDSDAITTFYTTLYPIIQPATASQSSTSTAAGQISSVASTTPFELRGSPLPFDTLAVAVAPAGDKVFTLENVNPIGGPSAGYVAQFNGAKKTQIFSTPLSALNVEWPEANTIAITTKGSSASDGFLYFVNPTNGIFNKILGDVRGLSTLTSKDATRVLYTATVNNSIKTSLYNVTTGTIQDMLFNTMPEKCVWSSLQKNILYCAVPTSIPSGTYPDDWYKGNISFTDNIWEVDTTTGDTHEIIDLLKTSGTVIDATNLVLDPKENYLYFINKRDLTLWSLQLNG